MDSYLNQSRNSSAQQRRYHIQKNSQGQNEIVIPYYQQQTPSAIYHMQEEIRLLKKHNRHLEEHIERMKEEYDELRKSIEFLDIKEKQHIKRNNELYLRFNDAISKHHEMKNQIDILKIENQEVKKDLLLVTKRQEDWKKKVARLKEQELALNSKISEQDEQIDTLKRQLIDKPKPKTQPKSDIQVTELKHKLTVYVQRVTLLTQQLQQKDKELNKLRNEEKGKDFEEYEDKIKKLQKEKKKLQQQLKQNEEESSKAILNSKNKYKQLQKELEQLHIQIQEYKKTIRKITQQSQQYEEQLKKHTVIKVSTDSPEVNKQLTSLEDQLQQMKFKLEQTQHAQQEQLNKLNKRIKELQQQNSQYSQQVSAMRNNLQQAQKDRDVWKTKYQELSNRNTQNDKLEETLQELKKRQEQLAQAKAQLKRMQEQLQKYKEQLMEAKKGQENKLSNDISFRKLEQEDKSIDALQTQYNNQLQALRRLIIYKRYPQTIQNEQQSKIRLHYESKMDIIVKEYQDMQKQLLMLREQLLLKKNKYVQETNEEEIYMYGQAIRKWQIAYEELQTLYEAKLVSKDEEINLLNLKLLNKYQY